MTIKNNLSKDQNKLLCEISNELQLIINGNKINNTKEQVETYRRLYADMIKQFGINCASIVE